MVCMKPCIEPIHTIFTNSIKNAYVVPRSKIFSFYLPACWNIWSYNITYYTDICIWLQSQYQHRRNHNRQLGSFTSSSACFWWRPLSTPSECSRFRNACHDCTTTYIASIVYNVSRQKIATSYSRQSTIFHICGCLKRPDSITFAW